MENKGCCMVKPESNACATGKDSGGKSPCCWGTLIKGMVIGGIVMFVYLMISWTVIPWHKSTVMSFKNDQAVAVALFENVEKSGIYMLPKVVQPKESPVDETAVKGKKPALATAPVEKPFAFVSVFKDGIDVKNMSVPLAEQFLLCLFGALLLTCLLKKVACGCPILLSLKVGVLVAVFNHVPNWIWYKFPCDYTLVGMADDIIAITLAGLVISKTVLKTGSCATGKA